MAFLPARNMADIVPIQVFKLVILTINFVRFRLAWGRLRTGGVSKPVTPGGV